ncbi:hypothetical protein FGG08_003358 [Glutinoglossum americanum]|uniref:Uncharacterized protein n=1 Tax=Glutinoglossum americanum TaxID=1670608 RepID=A0A9P8KY75_9PEZI|nr:hypothetical protein FGG08_003358 [Glutinoglossum americanum]
MGQVSLNPRKRPSDASPSAPGPTSTGEALGRMQSGTKKRRTQRPEERPNWVIDKEDSWVLDLHKLYGSVCGISRGHGEVANGQLGDLAGKELNGGLVVLCILGSTTVHLRALSSLSPSLSASYPTIGILGVSLHASVLHDYQFPIVHDSPPNITPALGLLHPLGGGREALDAIVVLDTCGRRRMVLPVGWGQSRHCTVSDELLRNTMAKLMANLMDGVRWLDKEWQEQREEELEEMEVDTEG